MPVANLYRRHTREALRAMSMELLDEMLRVNTALMDDGDDTHLTYYRHHIDMWDARIMAALFHWR